jgi:hypothetical protein
MRRGPCATYAVGGESLGDDDDGVFVDWGPGAVEAGTHSPTGVVVGAAPPATATEPRTDVTAGRTVVNE